MGNAKLIIKDKNKTESADAKLRKVYQQLRCTNESDLPQISIIHEET